MTALEIFQFPATGQGVRTILRDGEPWFVAKDACDVIGISKYRDAVAQLDADERVSTAVDTPGGRQTMVLVNEPGLFALMLISRSSKVKPFRRWVTHDVLPAIRKTGQYVNVREIPNRELARMVIEEADRADREAALRGRAESRVLELEPKAEAFEAIEGGDGIPLRVFHKKYFSEVKETDFFEHLYRKGYLIDQRGKGGWSEKRQKHRDGAQHRHPSYKGKPFIYLHASLDDRDNRHESPRVRPGSPELAFREALIRDGLPPNGGTAIERKAS